MNYVKRDHTCCYQSSYLDFFYYLFLSYSSTPYEELLYLLNLSTLTVTNIRRRKASVCLLNIFVIPFDDGYVLCCLSWLPTCLFGRMFNWSWCYSIGSFFIFVFPVSSSRMIYNLKVIGFFPFLLELWST